VLDETMLVNFRKRCICWQHEKLLALVNRQLLVKVLILKTAPGWMRNCCKRRDARRPRRINQKI